MSENYTLCYVCISDESIAVEILDWKFLVFVEITMKHCLGSFLLGHTLQMCYHLQQTTIFMVNKLTKKFGFSAKWYYKLHVIRYKMCTQTFLYSAAFVSLCYYAENDHVNVFFITVILCYIQSQMQYCTEEQRHFSCCQCLGRPCVNCC